MDPVLELSLEALAQRLKSGAVSSVAVTQACLARIAAIEPQVHAFERVLRDDALAAAQAADEQRRAGQWRGVLHGVPVALKDNIDLAGVPTSNSSRVRDGHVAAADSALVASLRRAGAVILGKACMHEFAFGGLTPRSRNPWDTQCTTGGSSGGSAAVVAYRGAFAAFGTDTAGSVRIPASFCGVVGAKPTFGLLDTAGITPLSWSLDHVGVLAQHARDAALAVREVLVHGAAGAPRRSVGDALAGTLAEPAPTRFAGLRVGLPENHFFERLEPDVEAAVRAACAALERLGAELVPVRMPHPEWLIPLETIISPAEASTYHAPTLRSMPGRYTEGTRARLELSSTILAVDYLHAQRVRGLLQAEVAALFESIDLLAVPTMPMPAMHLDPDVLDGTRLLDWQDGGPPEPLGLALMRYTTLANLTGAPAVSVPCGLSAARRPIGLQLIGAPGDDARVLQAAAAYEATRPWDDPPL